VTSVYVPGLGRFDAIFHPAVIELNQSRIKPPHIQPDFISNANSESEILPAYIHYVSGTDMDDAKEAISSFANEVIQHLDNSGFYSVEKFGTFSKSASEIIHFTPDWDAFNLSFSGLEIIDLQPVVETKIPERYFVASTPKPEEITPKVEAPRVEVIETTPVENIVIDEFNGDESINEQQETVTSDQPEIAESTSRLAWIILSSALLLIMLLCAFLARDIIRDRQRINQMAGNNADTMMITNEFDIPVLMDTEKVQQDSETITTPVEEPKTIEEPAETQVTEPPCFVVVGAFTNPENVNKMMDRLEGLGYKATKIEGGSLTRVAISTSCDKTNLEKILNEARSGINPESWIY
jgi:cell division septation protein DedD